MYGKVEHIGPDRAKKLLANLRTNRAIRRPVVERYKGDAKGGAWRLCPTGIYIDCKGKTVNGAHRLTMVVESGITLPFFVVYDVPDDAIVHIDGGLPRSLKDSLFMAGMGEYSNSVLATLKTFLNMPASGLCRRIGPEEVGPLMAKYGDGIRFADKHAQRQTRSVRACIARAWYHVDDVRLIQWCQILHDGIAVSDDRADDSAAIRFRTWLLENRSLAGHMFESERYRKCQTALSHFLDRKPMTKIYGTDSDVFPLPTVVGGTSTFQMRAG